MIKNSKFYANVTIGPYTDLEVALKGGVSRRTADSIRECWRSAISDKHHYSCHAIFLLLPGDDEAVGYASGLNRELHLLSGDICQVVIFTDKNISAEGYDEEIYSAALLDHVKKGVSLSTANLFGIDLTKFPCVLFFREIASHEYAVISLKGLTREHIIEKMRSVFSLMRKGMKESGDALANLIKLDKEVALHKKKGVWLSEVKEFSKSSLSTVVSTWIRTLV